MPSPEREGKRLVFAKDTLQNRANRRKRLRRDNIDVGAILTINLQLTDPRRPGLLGGHAFR